MKKIYLTILYIITAICVLFGCFLFVSNNSSFLPEKKKVGAEQNLESFHKLKMNMDIASLSVVYGDDFKIEYECSKDLEPVIKQTNDTLTITQTNKRKMLRNNSKCNITVTIKEGTSLDLLDIDSDIGTINLQELAITSFSCKADIGDIEMNDCTIEDGEIETDIGNIDLSSCSFEELTMTADTGNISIDSEQSLADYKIDISADLGEISYNGQDYKKSFHSQGTDKGKFLSIKSDLGTISLSD